MKAGEILISGIFNGSRLLEVPFYQRAYVWQEEQWERLLEDLKYVTSTRKQYFMGSIILKSGRTLNTWEKYSECKVIIDGQQRLTTLLIFMKVLCLKKNENKLFERDYILEDDSIALRHGQSDVEAFKKIVAAESDDPIENSEPKSQIIEAFNYFCENIDADLFDRTAIRQNVQFVCIDLTEDEDEQQVFDTINSLGVRLTTAELLKNYFFNQENVDEYKEKWIGVFEKDDEAKSYWDTEIETGRIRRSMIDIFFDSYFQIFVQDSSYGVITEDKLMYARVDRLAKSYQHFINTYCGGDKNVILSSLKEYADCFRENFDPTCCERSIPATYGIERLNVVIFGLKNMAMAGWKTTDMLGGIEGIMNLAAASGESLATTSDIVTDALTAFGLKADDAGHFSDVLAAASSNANTNVSMMGETFKYAAPIAGALGFSVEDTAEAIGLMANAGIKGSQAGTSLRTIMNNLAGEVKICGSALGEVTIQTTNADGSMRDLSAILADCRGAFSQLSESEQAAAAEALVGKNAMSGFLALMNAAPEDIDKLSGAIENCDGKSAEMAATMQDNLAGQLTILKSQLEELAISFGEILMPAIRSIVSGIQGFVDKLNSMN